MTIQNDDIRQFLISVYGQEAGDAVVLFPEYSDAFTGITMDGKAIYNLSKAGVSMALKQHITIAEATLAVKDELKRLCEAAGDKAPVIDMGSPFAK